MKVYCYNQLGYYVCETEADECQITKLQIMEQSQRELHEGEQVIEPVYLLPSDSTVLEPSFAEGHAPRFVGGVWILEEIVPEPTPEVVPEPEKTYSEKRAMEYPSFREFLDGIVKTKSTDGSVAAAGEAQVEKYIQDCLAIKAKYPKP